MFIEVTMRIHVDEKVWAETYGLSLDRPGQIEHDALSHAPDVAAEGAAERLAALGAGAWLTATDSRIATPMWRGAA